MLIISVTYDLYLFIIKASYKYLLYMHKSSMTKLVKK